MKKTRVRQVGGASGLILPKAIMDLAGVKLGTEFDVGVDANNNIILHPCSPTKHVYQVLVQNTDGHVYKSFQNYDLDTLLDESYADFCKEVKSLFKEKTLVDCRTRKELREKLGTRDTWLNNGFVDIETHYGVGTYELNEFDL